MFVIILTLSHDIYCTEYLCKCFYLSRLVAYHQEIKLCYLMLKFTTRNIDPLVKLTEIISIWQFF